MNIVNIDIKKYKEKNKVYWLALNLLMNLIAIYEKKPASSNTIDINDTEINKANIFNGFNFEFENKILNKFDLSNKGKIKNINATNKIGK